MLTLIVGCWLWLSGFGRPLGSLWADFRLLWLLWGDLGLPLGALGVALEPIGLPRARPLPGRNSSGFRGGRVPFRFDETTVRYTEPDPTDPLDPAEVVAASKPRTLPSTRAGG